jgi:CrcB protein
VVGCFLIGAVLQTSLSSSSFSPTLRLTLASGFLGGLTTYSAFAYETVALARAGSRNAALSNFALTTLGCFVAVAAGIMLAQLWSPAAPSQR